MIPPAAPFGGASPGETNPCLAPPQTSMTLFEAALAQVTGRPFSQPEPSRAPAPLSGAWRLEAGRLPAEVTQAIAASQARPSLESQMRAARVADRDEAQAAQPSGFGLVGSSVIRLEPRPGGELRMIGQVAYLDARSGRAVGQHALDQTGTLGGSESDALFAHDMTHLGSQLGVNLYVSGDPARQTNGLVNEALNDGFLEAVKAHMGTDPGFAAAVLAATDVHECADLQKTAYDTTGFGAASNADPRGEDRAAQYEAFAEGGVLGQLDMGSVLYKTTNVAERVIAGRFHALLGADPEFADTYARNWAAITRAVAAMQAGGPAPPFAMVNSTEYTHALLQTAVSALQDVLAMAPGNTAVWGAVGVYQALIQRGEEAGADQAP